MKKKALALAAAAVAALAVVAVSYATTSGRIRYHAFMTAKDEVPAQEFSAPKASGRLRAIVSRQGRSLRLQWSLTYKRLSSRVTGAHIHLGKPGKSGAILVPLCTQCGKAAGGFRTISVRIAKLIRSGNTYVNVHTKRNPKGEIRGQIVLGRG